MFFVYIAAFSLLSVHTLEYYVNISRNLEYVAIYGFIIFIRVLVYFVDNDNKNVVFMFSCG